MVVQKIKLSQKSRVLLYNSRFGKKWPDSRLSFHYRYIVGYWVVGNNFKNEIDYYGTYPRNYLERIFSMIPDKRQILHLFSGGLTQTYLSNKFPKHGHWLIDLKCEDDPPAKTIKGDAHKLTEYYSKNFFDAILADPPYSKEAAAKYGVKMPNRRAIIIQCHAVLKPHGILIWLDSIKPQYSNKMWELIGNIALDRSTNQKLRGIWFLQKKI